MQRILIEKLEIERPVNRGITTKANLIPNLGVLLMPKKARLIISTFQLRATTKPENSGMVA